MGDYGKRVGRMALIVVLGELAVHLASYLHLGLTGILLVILSYVCTSSVKAKTTEARIAPLVTAQGATTTRVNNLSGQQTGTASVGVTSTADGSPVTSGPSDTGFFNTGPQVGGAAAHYHTLPNFPQADHTHDFAGHVHDFGGHTHQIPTV
jgi:hypothetical protein